MEGKLFSSLDTSHKVCDRKILMHAKIYEASRKIFPISNLVFILWNVVDNKNKK